MVFDCSFQAIKYFIFDVASTGLPVIYAPVGRIRKAIVTLAIVLSILSTVLMRSSASCKVKMFRHSGSRFLEIFILEEFYFLPGVNKYIIAF